MFGVVCTVATSLGAPAAGLGTLEVTPASTRQVREAGSNIAWGQAEVVLDRPMAEVLPVVVDYDNYVRFMPHFIRSKVIARRGSRAMVYMEVSAAAGALTLWGQLNLAERVDERDTRIVEASLMEGNMTAFRARWTLEPIEDGRQTRVGFRIHVDPDLPVPSTLISRENERAAGNTLGALQERLAVLERRAQP